MPNMPPTWVVPNADPWPIRTRGFPLGAQVRIIRSRQVIVFHCRVSNIAASDSLGLESLLTG